MKSKLSIIIPVYNATSETIDCVHSILNSDAADYPIYLLDDASLDGVSVLIDEFKTKSNVKIISNFRNRGYTRNISIGLDLAESEFLCILNSDTLVPKAWSDKLLTTLKSNPRLAAVGPMSNAASYQSFPNVHDEDNGTFSLNNGLGFKVSDRQYVSQALKLLSQGTVLDVPILNGFCTIFRSSFLKEINGFDVDNFPEGYGEENDICIRLRARGYLLAIDLGVFVHHQKSKSFGNNRKKELSLLGGIKLRKLYGKDMMSRLENQLKDDALLKILRGLMALHLSERGQASLKHIVYEKGTQLSLKTAQNKYDLVTLSGGAKYSISNEIISRSENKNINHIELSSTKGELFLSLPYNVNLTLDSSKPIASSLLALGLLSSTHLVYVKEWDLSASLDNQLPTKEEGWPDAWGLDQLEQIEYCLIHFDI